MFFFLDGFFFFFFFFFFTATSDVHIQLGGYVLHCRILGTSQETEKWLKWAQKVTPLGSLKYQPSFRTNPFSLYLCLCLQGFNVKRRRTLFWLS